MPRPVRPCVYLCGFRLRRALSISPCARCAGLEDVELDPSGSIGGYPIPPGLYEHLSTVRIPIAIVFFVLAALQLFRATVSCVIKERLQRCGLSNKLGFCASAAGFLYCVSLPRSIECPSIVG